MLMVLQFVWLMIVLLLLWRGVQLVACVPLAVSLSVTFPPRETKDRPCARRHLHLRLFPLLRKSRLQAPSWRAELKPAARAPPVSSVMPVMPETQQPLAVVLATESGTRYAAPIHHGCKNHGERWKGARGE
jgi:hypothetical protein